MFSLGHARESKVVRAAHRFIVGKDGASGAALVELVVLAPILVAMALYTIDLGLLAFRKMEVQYAAQAGAQYAIGQTSYDATTIASAVTNATKFTAITPSSNQWCGCVNPSNWSAGVTVCTNATAGCDQCNKGAGAGVSTSTCVMGNYVSVTATPTTAYTPLAPFGVARGTYNIGATSTVRIR
jgi:Flp pilus assembly protein TadG